MADELIDELLTIERQGWDALCDGSGSDFYGKTMTSDAQMVLANGSALTRDDVVGALRGAPAWAGYQIGDVRLVTTGQDSAALVYQGTASPGGDADDFVCLFTSTYVRVNGSWRLALYTQTPVS